MRGYVEWLESEARERPASWNPMYEDYLEAAREKADAARDRAKDEDTASA
jgi:hypothetical protein